MSTIEINGKIFTTYLEEDKIQSRILDMADQLSREYQGNLPLFLIILNGASFFAIDLIKNYSGRCNIAFTQLSSYQGTESTGSVKTVSNLPENLNGRHIIIIEDIIDTGLTISHLYENILQMEPASIKVCTLLDKPSKRLKEVAVEWIGFTIPDVFVVGYGLDYDGLGRNSKEILALVSY